MTNQLITYRLPIDYSLISLMSSISYVWSLTRDRSAPITGKMVFLTTAQIVLINTPMEGNIKVKIF